MKEMINTHHSQITDHLMENIDNDSAREILYKILTISDKSVGIVDTNTETENQNVDPNTKFTEHRVTIINEIFKAISTHTFNLKSLDEENKLIAVEKIKNLFIILIKFIKILYRFNNYTLESILKELISQKNIEIVESIITHIRSDNKMSDEKYTIDEHEIKIYENILLYFSELTQSFIISADVIVEIEGIITKYYYLIDADEEDKTLNDNQFNNISTTNNNMQESFKEVKAQPFVNSFYSINEDTRKALTEYYIKLFPVLLDLTDKVKHINKGKSIQTLQNNNTITPAGQTYLSFLDLFLVLLMIKNENFKHLDIIFDINSDNNYLTNILMKDIFVYPNNSFLLIKIIKIFEIILFNEFYNDIKVKIVNNPSVFQYLLEKFNRKTVDIEK